MYKILKGLLLGCCFIVAFGQCKKKSADENKGTAPRVITKLVSAITATGAITGGTIATDGGSTITESGVCRSNFANPTIEDFIVLNDGGGTDFISGLTGLLPGTTYHIRAYATNAIGISYGDDVSFTTLASGATILMATVPVTNITGNSAVSGGVIFSSPDSVTQRGVCWDVSPIPTIGLSTKTINGSDTGTFASNVTGLQPATTYYLRAYAVNSRETVYGDQDTFTTVGSPPSVTTNSVTFISAITATCGGNVTASGGGNVTARGVCWSTASAPLITDAHTTNGTGTGPFNSSLSGLTGNTTYHVRAYATSVAGTSYGNEVVFTTLATTPTVVTAQPVSSSATTATGGGNVTDDGGSPVTSRGICWNTTGLPTNTLTTKTIDGTGVGTFTSLMTGLTANTTYYVRAYASNSAGVAYGTQVTVVASANLPTLTTVSATSITAISAVSGGNVTIDGGAPVTSRGICWSTAPAPTTALTTKVTSGAGLGTFSSNITGLVGSTTYYIRAFAVNSAGTAYGNEVIITTSPQYAIGQSFGGGKIFYVDGTGQHGLIAGLTDISAGAPWGCPTLAVGTTHPDVGMGWPNSLEIMNVCAQTGIAARLCRLSTLNGYTDWFLPSKDELQLLYAQRTVVGGFIADYYWTSTEYDVPLPGTPNLAWAQSFASGVQQISIKDGNARVRAIRAF